MAEKRLPLEKLERSIPDRAARAVKVAYKNAINSGHSVLIASNGRLFQVNPDMSRQELAKLPQASKVKKGTRTKLK